MKQSQSEDTQIADYSPLSPGFRTGEEYVIDATTLASIRHQPNLKIIDVRRIDQCPDGHIPGAIMFDVSILTSQDGDFELKPEKLSAIFGSLGILPGDFVVAYDDDTGVDAARLLWTLHSAGHKRYALLDGGFGSWDDAELDVEAHPAHPVGSSIEASQKSFYPITALNDSIANQDLILKSLGDPDTIIIDTRSAPEYLGVDKRAKRGGHIPGAIHFDWEESVDRINGGILRNPETLLEKLVQIGVTSSKSIIVYCQTNRRSSHTFVVLKWLGFNNVKAYPGSWAEWGNNEHTPYEPTPLEPS